MNDFEKHLAEVVANKLSDGSIEKIINDKIEEAIKKALEDVFSYRGAAKELLEKKIAEVIVPLIEHHDFNKYLIKLDEVLTSIVNQTNLSENRNILRAFEGCMKEPGKKEVKLSEIFEMYIKHVADNVSTDDLDAECEDGEPYYECVTANLEVEYVDKGWLSTSRFDDCFVNFSCEEDENLNCQIKLYKSTDSDSWSILRGVGAIEIGSLKHLSEFEVFLSVIQRSFCKIIIDTESECADDIEPTEKPEWHLN